MVLEREWRGMWNLIRDWVREKTESLRVIGKKGNWQPWETGGWREPPECTRDLGGERL